MGFANLFLGRSASRVASAVCGGRVRSIFTRPSLLVHNSCPLRPFVPYSTAASAIEDDWISSEKAVLQEIDSEYNAPVTINTDDVLETFFLSRWKDRSLGVRTPPESFPFKIEDIPGSRTVTLTREYNGEHIKVVVSMPITTLSDDDDDALPLRDDDGAIIIYEINDDAPSNESHDVEKNENKYIPVVVTVTKKSGLSLVLHCKAYSDASGSYHITTGDIHMNLPGHTSEDPKMIRDIDDTIGMDHEDLKETFNKYLAIRGLDVSTLDTIHTYMLDKMKEEYWLWLDYLKEFMEEEHGESPSEKRKVPAVKDSALL